MTEIFVVNFYSHDGASKVIFSTLESAERLAARLNKHKIFIEKHNDILRPHEYKHTDEETGEKFLFAHTLMSTRVMIERKILHQ